MFHLKNDRPRLVIEHETNFALPGNIKRPCNSSSGAIAIAFVQALMNDPERNDQATRLILRHFVFKNISN